MVRHFFSQGENADIDANTNYPPQSATHIFQPPLLGDMEYEDADFMQYEDPTTTIMEYEGT